MNKPIDIRSTVLHTPRLTLRPWRQEDLHDFFAYASVDGVGQMAGWLPHKSLEESQQILNRFIANGKTFALEHRGTVIGSLGIETYPEEAYPELNALQGRSIGYVLSKDYWGQGLMPEAVQAVIQYLFETEQLDFIRISHFQHNSRSQRVIRKCGFHPVGQTIHRTSFGTEERTVEYLLFKKEWRQAYAES